MATTVTLKPNAIDLSGSTSGTTTLQASAVAGTTTVTLPAATDTLVGKATTDTLTNKTLTAPILASANITTALTLTSASGTSGQVLTSAGSGAAPTWTTIAGATGGGSDNIFYENGQTVNTSYSITAEKNAGSFGPITVASSVTVTVPTGSTWSIV